MTREVRRGGNAPMPRAVDVARLAGVSQKTVSRVLNNEQYVSAEVRRRVLAAAEELGYRLNNAARALASGRSSSAPTCPSSSTALRCPSPPHAW